jgi:hypothetical protein
MDLLSHIVLAALLAHGRMSWWLILGAILPDFDKILTYPRGYMTTHRARTAWAELPLSSLLILMALPIHTHLVLGMVSHHILDYLVGETRPFYPFFKSVVSFNLRLRYKALLAVILWFIGGVLSIGGWIHF